MARATILIVEDDENIQQLVGYNLAKAGFQVLYAENGEQALASVKRELPDLMVLDIMLPSLNGFEVCKILRKDPQTKTLPIIMLTAKGEENDVTAGLDLGAGHNENWQRGVAVNYNPERGFGFMRYYILKPEGLVAETIFFHCSKSNVTNDTLFLDPASIFEFRIVINTDNNRTEAWDIRALDEPLA